MSMYKAFSSSMKTGSRGFQSRGPSYTDRRWEKQKDEYQRRADSAHSREMNQIMRGRK